MSNQSSTIGTAFIEVHSGRAFFPLAPKWEDIDIRDIAHALSQQCRFSGHTVAHYSVAEHSVRVAELLERWGENSAALWGLLHDASEAYLVDIPLPLKRHPDFEPYRRAETAMQAAVCRRFGLSCLEPEAVRRADAVLLATEVRDLMPARAEHWTGLTQRPLPDMIVPWPASVAERVFLSKFGELR